MPSSSSSSTTSFSSKYDKYFTRIENANRLNQWACKLCGLITVPTIHTTTEIRRHHLKTRHPTEFGNIEPRKPKAPVERKRKIKENIITNTPLKKLKPAEDDVNSEKIENTIMELIATTNLPLSAINHPAFDRLVKLLNPIYILKNTDYFLQEKLPDLYSKLSTKIQAVTSTLNNYSIVISEFAEERFSHSLFLITLHFLDDELKPNYFILAVFPMYKMKIAEKLPLKLEQIFTEFSLDWSKVTHFLQAGSSGSADLREVNDWDIEICLANGLQQCVEDAVLAMAGLDTVIAKAKKLIRKLRKSKSLNQAFPDYQRFENLPEKCLDIEVQIFWNILYSILLSFQGNKINLQILCVQNGFKGEYTLDQNEWELLEEFVESLSGFYQATTLLSRPDSTISSIIPIIKVIMLDLENKKRCNKGNPVFIDALFASLQSRFSSALISQANIIATLLDPRFKEKYFSPSMNNSYKEWIINELAGENNDNTSAIIVPKIEVVEQDDNNEEEDDLFEMFEKANAAKRALPGGDGKKQIIEAELIKYLHEARISRDSSPSDYWHVNFSRFPYLQQLYCRHATAPASNVESDKLFSIAGDEIDKMRKSLNNQTLKKLLFLNCNFKFLESNFC